MHNRSRRRSQAPVPRIRAACSYIETGDYYIPSPRPKTGQPITRRENFCHPIPSMICARKHLLTPCSRALACNTQDGSSMLRRPTIRVGAAGKPERNGSARSFRKNLRTRFFPTKLPRIRERSFPEKAKPRSYRAVKE